MATAAELRKRSVDLMVSRKRKNKYTQGNKRGYFFGYPSNKPGNTVQKGYSDCSEAVRRAIMAATGIDIGINTTAQINNREKKGLVVHTTGGYYPDESKLLPGDCLYFKGNTKHPMDVGHVEMYIGNGQVCGHGSGTGPKIQNMTSYCKKRANSKKRYFMAIRWILDDGEAETVSYKLGDRILRNGCAGDDVKTLQNYLIQLGYDCGDRNDDGKYGDSTEIAVEKFQREHGCTVDGEVGPETIEALKKATGGAKYVQIVNGDCYIRTAPSKTGDKLGVAKKGEKLPYGGTTHENGWNFVEYEEKKYGWVSGLYSKLIE